VRPPRSRSSVFGALAAVLVLVSGCAAEEPQTGGAEGAPTAISVPTRTVTPTQEPTVASFDKAALSIDDPSSIWVVVNRARALNPEDYSPGDLVDVPVEHTWDPMLRQEASDAAVALFAAARTEAALVLASNSAYRSYSTQVRLFSPDDPTTAPPGHSEHQTGLAIDIGAGSGYCSIEECFADTPEGQWLAANAWRFGFLLRYPADKIDVTGYTFEPWHFRYIGVELATEMHTTGVTTLEEFFELPAAPM